MSVSTGVDTARISQAAYSSAWTVAAALCRPVLWASRLLRLDAGRLEGKLGLHASAGKAAPTCWIHASSVGEAGIALRCMDALRRARPELRFILTSVTPEGRAFARQRVRTPDLTAWFPFDAPACVRRAYEAFAPAFVVLCEVELWPNHLREARARGIPVFVVNGRLSERDARNYRMGGRFIRNVFALPDLVCARSEEDAAHFSGLGARHVVVSGDMKFDPLPGTAAGQTASVRLPDESPVLLGASTHPGEETMLLDIFRSCRAEFPKLLLVLVPRHPARAATIRSEARRLGLTGDSDFVVVDAVGQLPELYQKSTVAFVGKSMTARGGQNFLEAVEAGCPVVFGPHMENFAEAAMEFVRAEAVRQAGDGDELAGCIRELLRDPELRSSLRRRASAVLQARQGATARTVRLIQEHLSRGHSPAAAFTGP